MITFFLLKNYLAENQKPKKISQNICPDRKPNLTILEGQCEGDWGIIPDQKTKVTTCQYKPKKLITCPEDSISLGQVKACDRTIEQLTEKKISSLTECQDLFANVVRVSYRLVCCL